MIELDTINAVVSQYERFGWRLERILLKEPVGSFAAVFQEIPITLSKQDALWFSRDSPHGSAWELRRLSGSPFALVRVIASEASDAERDEILAETEAEMLARDVKTDDVISNGK